MINGSCFEDFLAFQGSYVEVRFEEAIFTTLSTEREKRTLKQIATKDLLATEAKPR
jgi:hypothetical protein